MYLCIMRIQVKNLGPITEADIELRPLTIFIGKEGTGKSTMAKLVYALHKLPIELLDILTDVLSLLDSRTDSDGFNPVRHVSLINSDQSSINKEIKDYISMYVGLNIESSSILLDENKSILEYLTNDSEREKFQRKISEDLKNINDLNEIRESRFKEGMSVFTTNGNQIFNTDAMFFIEGRGAIEQLFYRNGLNFYNLVYDNLKESKSGILTYQYIQFIDKFIKSLQFTRPATYSNYLDSILRIAIEVHNGLEYFRTNHNISLIDITGLSTGQRDTYRIVMDIIKMLEVKATGFKRLTLRVIEELEAHNHPETIQKIFNLMTEVVDENHQFVLTTHHETLLNMCMNWAISSPENAKKLAVYHFNEDGVAEKINDDETGVIRASDTLFKTSIDVSKRKLESALILRRNAKEKQK